jgi:hypothetical protein
MEGKALLNRGNILTPHKPLGQELPSLQFMWPLGAQPLNILDISIQRKRQSSSSQDLSLPFAKSPFFSARSKPAIQRRRNTSQVDLSSSPTVQLKRDDSDVDIYPPIPQLINELEPSVYSETENNNLSSNQLFLDENEASVEAPESSVDRDLNQSSRLNEMDNPQQTIELTKPIPAPEISFQTQPDSINLSKLSDDLIVSTVNEEFPENHNVSTNLDIGGNLESQDYPIDLPTDPTVTLTSPINLNLKADRNPASVFFDSPPIESSLESSIQKSTISTPPGLSLSVQDEVVSDEFQPTKKIGGNGVASTSKLVEINTYPNLQRNVDSQPEIAAPTDVANSSEISPSLISPISEASHLDLTSIGFESQSEVQSDFATNIQLSSADFSSLSSQDNVSVENTATENNISDISTPFDSDLPVINTSLSNKNLSDFPSQETALIADSSSSYSQDLTSSVSADMSAVIVKFPIDSPKSPQADTAILSSQADVVARSNELIDPRGNDDAITTIAEPSLASSIISPLLESGIETIFDDQESLNLDPLSPTEPPQMNDLSNLNQTFGITSNSEAEPSEVELPRIDSINRDTSSSILAKTEQRFDLNDTRRLTDILPVNSDSSVDFVEPDRDIPPSDQQQSRHEKTAQPNVNNISIQQAPLAINRSLSNVFLTENLNEYQSMDQFSSIQLSPESENINSPEQELNEFNRIEIDSSFPDPPQRVMPSQITPEAQGQNWDGVPSTIATQSSPLSIAKSSGELLEQVSESSETSSSDTSIEINSSAINPDINQSSVDLLATTDFIEASESINAVPSQTQEENIAELNHDATNRTETGSINDPLQRRIEPITESTPIESTLSDSINRFDDPAPPINLGPVSSETGNYMKKSPEINQEIPISEEILIGDDRQWDDVESPPSVTDSIDISDALSISTAMPRVLQRLSILDPQLTQPRSSSQAVNYISSTNPPLSTSLSGVSSTIQQRLSNDTGPVTMSSTSYSPVLQRFSTEESTTDRFDDRSDSPEMTSSWGSISDLLNSTNIDNTPTSFGAGGSPGQEPLTMQAKSIEKAIPIFNNDRSFSEPTQTEQPFVDLRPYDSLSQSIDTTSPQVTDSMSSNPTAYIAKLNSEPQPVPNQESIIESSDRTESETNTDAHPKDNQAGLEELAQITYRLIRQKIAIERERSGGNYSGRLPW